MSEKPFWEGKTCEEMAGLHVKVTFNNGAVLTGVTNEDGDIPISVGNTDFICALSDKYGSADFKPKSYFKSIELVEDPNYERIEEADDLQKKDIAVMLDGNRYKVIDMEKDRNRFWGRVYGAVGQECIALGFNAFTYGLRPKPRLPDKPGLWLDKDDNTWMFKGGSIQCIRIGTGKWNLDRPWISADGARAWHAAPFRPVKAVEA